MRCTLFAVAALTALTNALPVAVPEVFVLLVRTASISDASKAQLIDTTPGSTIELGDPSTVVTWGKRDLVDTRPGSTIELGEPSTVVTWGKRGVDYETPNETIELSEPSTEVTWGKE